MSLLLRQSVDLYTICPKLWIRIQDPGKKKRSSKSAARKAQNIDSFFQAKASQSHPIHHSPLFSGSACCEQSMTRGLSRTQILRRHQSSFSFLFWALHCSADTTWDHVLLRVRLGLICSEHSQGSCLQMQFQCGSANIHVHVWNQAIQQSSV